MTTDDIKIQQRANGYACNAVGDFVPPALARLHPELVDTLVTELARAYVIGYAACAEDRGMSRLPRVKRVKR
jgi:hypothetical protein